MCEHLCNSLRPRKCNRYRACESNPVRGHILWNVAPYVCLHNRDVHTTTRGGETVPAFWLADNFIDTQTMANTQILPEGFHFWNRSVVILSLQKFICIVRFWTQHLRPWELCPIYIKTGVCVANGITGDTNQNMHTHTVAIPIRCKFTVVYTYAIGPCDDWTISAFWPWFTGNARRIYIEGYTRKLKNRNSVFPCKLICIPVTTPYTTRLSSMCSLLTTTLYIYVQLLCIGCKYIGAFV